jgi:glucose-6-phosphate 1-dehydrogenase
MPHHLIILGATGDLTNRYLGPALVALHANDRYPIADPVVAVGREGWDSDRFREHLGEQLGRHAADFPERSRRAVVEKLAYRSADISDPVALGRLVAGAGGPVVLYLALPPAVGGKVIEALADLDLPPDSRVVAEKPFGDDLASARRLNELLHRTLPERAVFRMDHFLGKQTVQNVLGVRFANRVFEPVWNRGHVERVEIVWDETLGLEGRAGYYDTAGALRDMVQNHLLQLLALVAMEAPTRFDEQDFRDRKVQVLRAVRRLAPDEVTAHTRRGRYTAGRAGGRDLPAYADEDGVDPGRNTETFAQVTLFVDNDRWAGVPFVLRTGKALAADRHEIAVHFRPAPHTPFGETPAANVLRLKLNPDRLELGVNINGPGHPFELEAVTLDAALAPQELPAYARLLLDVFEGDAVLSIRGDEAEECWRIVEPILEGWAGGRVPLDDYPAGSDGPARRAE